MEVFLYIHFDLAFLYKLIFVAKMLLMLCFDVLK